MSGAFDTELLVRRVVPLTHDVASFVLEAPTGWDGRFDAGQHLILSQQFEGHAVERCYTISSPPTRPGTLTVTVKRQPDGVFSPWLHDKVRAGDRVRARGPYGEFTLRAHPAPAGADHPAGAYLFLSAGSGITPMLAMTRALADQGSDADVQFVHSARTPADIVHRRELAAWGESGLAVRVTCVCEDDAPGDRWSGPSGRLSANLMRWLVPDLAEREVFVCGPPGYMEATTTLLDGLGIDPERVHRESFNIGGAEDLFGEESAPAGARLELRRRGTSVECGPEESVLDAVQRAGVMLRSSCRQGLCGTCKLTLLQGEVDMRHQGGIRQREIDRGGFLPCCSRPLGDLVIDA